MSDNPLLDTQLEEAAEVAAFINSPAWKWLKSRLESVRPRLIVGSVAPGQAHDDRLLAMGKLALVEEILTRPAMLADILRSHLSRPEPPPTVFNKTVGQSFTPGPL